VRPAVVVARTRILAIDRAGKGNMAEGQSAALREAFAAETRRGVGLAIVAWALWFFVGTIALTLLAQFLASHYHANYRLPLDAVVIGTLASLASLPVYFLARRSPHPLTWCFLALAIEILSIAQNKFFWFWSPPIYAHLPLFLAVRNGEIQAFFILLAIYILPLSRRFIALGCAAALAVWIIGIVNAYRSFPGASLYWGPFGPAEGADGFRSIMNIATLSVDYFVVQIVLLIAFAAFLALSIEQGRRFVIGRVGAHGDSDFLMRFFPSGVAARIGNGLQNALRPAHRHVAILFVGAIDPSDLALAERSFERIAASVFAHGGTIDRFTGGPVMACFGALDEDANASLRALACARELSNDRTSAIALHAGTAVCGDVGGTHSRAFSVIGDVVNTTRRILDAALAHDTSVLASEAFLSDLPAGGSFGVLLDLGNVALRGRAMPVKLWKLT
jgi:adenylate cyclase